METKICSKCGEEKEISEFYKSKTSKSGYRGACISCTTEKHKEYYQNNKQYFYENGVKNRNKNRESYLERSRSYNLNNEHKVRDSYFKRTYGISLDDYNKLLELQKNKCCICGKEEVILSKIKHDKVNNLSVDHDHKTGKVRGLLCGKCNKSIGLLNDDISLLKSAIAYLEKHQEVL
jgi:hypothetical protein